MNRDPESFSKKSKNRFDDKKKHKKFISEETQDQNKIKKIFKHKKTELRANELWEDWQEENEIY